MASDRRRWRVREKMEGDRKFQRGNLSEVQNMSKDQNLFEVQISEVQNLSEENKRKENEGNS